MAFLSMLHYGMKPTGTHSLLHEIISIGFNPPNLTVEFLTVMRDRKCMATVRRDERD